MYSCEIALDKNCIAQLFSGNDLPFFFFFKSWKFKYMMNFQRLMSAVDGQHLVMGFVQIRKA